MDSIFRPKIFDADPNNTLASKLWNHWFRTFSHFVSLAAADINKLELLINCVSSDVYEYIAECHTYNEAILALEKLYIKPKNEVFARHLLSTCKQENDQNLDQFLQKLRLLAKDCNFRSVTATQNQNDGIRDAFISGMQSHTIRQRLLENTSLDLETAYEQARALEMAYHQSTCFHTADHPVSASTNKTNVMTKCDSASVSYQSSPTKTENCVAAVTSVRCFFCGFSKHPRFKCPARDAVCKLCGKKGHFQKVCRSSSSHKNLSVTGSLLSSITIAAAPSSLSNACTQIIVNGTPLQALIDTGSSESYVSSAVAETHKWKVEHSFNKITMASTNLTTNTLGHCCVNLLYKDNIYRQFKLSVLPKLCADVLLGHDFLRLHEKLEISFGGNLNSLSLCALVAARIEPPLLFNNLTPDCKPVATKSRRHSHSDEHFIRMEIKHLLEQGIIEPSRSPWRAQVLVTTNERHKRRMVVDYSQTINRFTLLDAYPLPRMDELVEKISQFTVFSTLDLKSAYHQIPIKAEDKAYTAFEACGNLYQFSRIPFGVTNGVSCFQRVIDQLIQSEKLSATFAYLDNITVCGKDKDDHDRNLSRLYEAAQKYGLTFNESKSIIATNNIRLLGYEVSYRLIKPDPERLKPLWDLPLPHDVKSLQRIIGLFAYYSQWIPRFSDKIHPLINNRTFPLPDDVVLSYKRLKEELAKATVTTVDPTCPLVVETDASDIAIAAILTQNCRPVAFFSRTLSTSERHHSAVEKEAYAIIEAVRKWRHYLLCTHFQLVTDQRSVAFMYDLKHSSKIKNDKIQRWRIELSGYSFDVIYRSGKENQAADALSRGHFIASTNTISLQELHNSLCHPGVVRLLHFVRSRNLPFSVDDVKHAVAHCSVCAELKPRYADHPTGSLVKATAPFERLNIDFKGPLPSSTRNRYLLTVIDEYSRFPFAFPCSDMTAKTVITCLTQLFSVFGMSSYVHSDRGSSFMSDELKRFLHDKGIVTSRTTAYNPQSNGQAERLNGTLWRSITLAAKSRGLPINQWELVLPDALHSIRSLLCTATNSTPHERLFAFNRKSTSGVSLPSWLATPGPVLMRRPIRLSKYEPLVDEVHLIECNPKYAHVRLPDGREETVSIHQLAPKPPPTPTSQDCSDEVQSIHCSPTNDKITRTPYIPETEEPINSPNEALSLLEQQQQRVRPYNLRNREA